MLQIKLRVACLLTVFHAKLNSQMFSQSSQFTLFTLILDFAQAQQSVIYGLASVKRILIFPRPSSKLIKKTPFNAQFNIEYGIELVSLQIVGL